MHMKESIWKILSILLVLLFIVGIFYYSLALPKDYTIPGVPYYGVFTRMNFDYFSVSNAASSIMTILRYWGDERLSERNINSRFPSGKLIKFEEVKDFFVEQKYNVEEVKINSDSDLWKYINPRKNIPILVLIPRKDISEIGKGYAVIIGILKSKRSVLLHQAELGNNFVASYEDIGLKNGLRALVITPSKEIKSLIKGPDYSKKYPKRLSIMDDPDIQRIMKKWRKAYSYSGFSAKELREKGISLNDILALLEDVHNDPAFSKLHPASRVRLNTSRADIMVTLGRNDEAIKLVMTEIAPINRNLNQAYMEWPAGSGMPPVYASVWTVLGRAYIAKGQTQNAIKALENAIRYGDNRDSTKKLLERARR
jgi:hypothetical protein